MSLIPTTLQPTFTGYVGTTQDALILFEACLQEHLPLALQRIPDREKSTLIKSGAVFVYDENTSGIKRWTDGVTWSPSRILENFLVYRELDKPFPPGEKKRAIKRTKRMAGAVDSARPASKQYFGDSASSKMSSGWRNNECHVTNAERQLIGSLVSSYSFKASGLVKKTMSVAVHDALYHLVSYYNVEDVRAGRLHTPSRTEALKCVRPRPALYSEQNFRAPIEIVEAVHEPPHQVLPSNKYNRPTCTDYLPQQYPPTVARPVTIPQNPSSLLSRSPPIPQPMLHTNQQDWVQLDYRQYSTNFLSERVSSVPAGLIPMLLPEEICQSWTPQYFVGPSTSTLSFMP
ncbi:Global transcription regulator sge1 [Lithohypha guttulata]|nr:Global transcription regulator sge1 [Lithohypha guttulata]